MTRFSLGRSLAALLLLPLIAAGFAAATEKGKIPVTTSSEKALELFIKGRDLTDKLRFQESRGYFEKAVAEDPNFPLAYMSLAVTQPSVADYFKYFGKAVNLIDKVSRGERLMILATQAANNGESMKQKKLLEELTAAYPDDERAHNLLGNYYFGTQDYPAAIEQYNLAININPEFSQPYNQLGYSHRLTGNYDKAERAFQKYIDLIPDDPNPYDSYAELLLKMGKFKKSIELYRKALKINPNFVASYLGIATDYNLMGQHRAARKSLQELLETARDDGQRRNAYFAEAVSYVDEGNLEAGIESLWKQYTLAQSANDASSMAADLINIGNIQLEQGVYDMAINNFGKAINIMEGSRLDEKVKDNARRTFLFNSARVDLMMGDIEAAREKSKKHLAEATALGNPFQIWLSHELAGMIALQEKDYDHAIELLQQSNLQNPYNHYRLSLAYMGKGETDKARAACETAAHYNALNNLNYAFIRDKAEKMLASL